MRLAPLALLLCAQVARASVVSDTDIHFRMFKVDDKGNRTTLDAAQISRQFSQAVCLCQEKFDVEVYLSSTVIGRLGSVSSGSGALWAGTACNDVSTTMGNLTDRCVRIDSRTLGMFTQTQVFHVTADQFSVAQVGGMLQACPAQAATPGIWMIIDENNDGTPEASAKLDIPYDGLPPEAPIGVSALAGNEAVKLSWDVDMGAISDVDGFQVFCARGDGLQVFGTTEGPTNGVFTPGYKSTATECPNGTPLPAPDGGIPIPGADGGASAIVLAPVDDGGTSTGGAIAPYGPFTTLDPLFICSDRLAKTVRDLRIPGLQNGIPYEFAVVAIDKVGNASTIPTLQLVYPQGDEDAWTHYKDAGGAAEGGLCAVVRDARAAATAGVGLCALVIALGVRRRIRR